MIRVCGVDEAGRGPLAGAVFAAAVILDPNQPIEGLADSKQLSERKRERLSIEIRAKALAWSIATASAMEIDSMNILQATMLAMSRAVEGLRIAPHEILVDGNDRIGIGQAGRSSVAMPASPVSLLRPFSQRRRGTRT